MTSISDNRKKRGRPTTGIGAPVGLRLYPELDAKLEAWIATQPEPRPSRPEAIRLCLSAVFAEAHNGGSTQKKLTDLVAELFVAERLYERTMPQDPDVKSALSAAFNSAYAIALGTGVAEKTLREASSKLGKRKKLDASESRW